MYPSRKPRSQRPLKQWRKLAEPCLVCEFVRGLSDGYDILRAQALIGFGLSGQQKRWLEVAQARLKDPTSVEFGYMVFSFLIPAAYPTNESLQASALDATLHILSSAGK